MTIADDVKRLFPWAEYSETLSPETEESLAELAELGIEIPRELALFCQCIEDGCRVDLSAVGGDARHDLCDVGGLVEENDPDQGTFGATMAEDGTRGVVLFGYGVTQLVLDAAGTLGPKGAVYKTSGMMVTKDDAQRLAGSLEELLARAKPYVA